MHPAKNDVCVRARRVLMTALAALATVAMSAPEAQAQQVRKKFKDKIHVIQRKPVLQKKRFELAPRFGVSFNDPLYRSFKVGLNANYHITERLFVGGTFDWYDFGGTLGGPTDAYEKVISQANSAADTPIPNFSGGLEVGFVPIFGKFSLFNSKLGFYDVGISAGGGYVSSKSVALPAASGGAGGTVSVFTHLFINEWVSLNFEIRDTIYFATLQGADGTSMSHAVTAAGGVGLFFPKKFTYTTAESSEQ